MQLYHGINNKTYTTGKKIGQGGEGVVFHVLENSTQVIKIYSESLSSDKINKLMFMTSMVNDQLVKFAAWPNDVVRDSSGKHCGFVMRKLEAFVPLHHLFSPMDRKHMFPDKGYNFLVHVARNLAVAFHHIHEFGIVIGDVNETNILVSSTGVVALIDCDSFQIRASNKYHFCDVGVPRYTPPELLIQGSFDQVIRTINTDNFSLATLIFQLLFLGRAPYTGINLTGQEIDEETAIKTQEFAYSLQRKNKKLFPAKNSLTLNTMPSGIKALFHSAFEQIDHRPKASMWVNELVSLTKIIVQCSKTKIHFYPNVIGECPWCQFRHKSNIHYFLDDSYMIPVPELNNLDEFVNGFKLEKIEIKKLSNDFTRPNMESIPIASNFKVLKWINLSVISLAIIITLILCFIVNWGFIAIGFIAILIYRSISPFKKNLQEELESRLNLFNNLKLTFENLLNQHNQPAELIKYNQISQSLANRISDFRRLPEEFILEKKKIEERYFTQSLNSFLSTFDILKHSIPSYGSAKKLLIYNNGIRTAADVSKLSRIKISGIGPYYAQILISWRRQISSGFTYLPDTTSINREISAAANKITQRKQILELEIKKEYKSLLLIKNSILETNKQLEYRYEELSKNLNQAKLDLDSFKKFYETLVN